MAQSTTLPSAADQARILGNYLLRKDLPQQLIDLYERSLRSHDVSDKEDKLLSFAFSHPHLLACIDAYAALRRPGSEIRNRAYLLFSIVEASPYYTTYFLPQQRSPLYLLTLAGVSIRAVLRLLIGSFVITIERL